MHVKLVDKPRGKVILYFPKLWVPQWPVWPPLSMYAVATALLHAGYEVLLIDERGESDARDKLAAALPDALFLGISAKIGDQCRNMEAVAAFAKSVRPSVPVVVGGWFPGLFPEATLESPHVDIAVVGPADVAAPEIADRLLAGRSLRGVKNVHAKEGGEIVRNQTGDMPRLEDTHPIPWEKIGIQRYIHPHGWLSYFTSRGCPGGCTFCGVYCLNPRRWTALPPERVLADMDILVNRIGAKALKIMDTDFLASRSRVEKICRLIIERGLKVRFDVLGRHYSMRQMTDQQIRLLRQAGCTQIEVGLESGEQRLADMMNKQLDVTEFVPMARRFVAAGIRIRANVMVGMPTETVADLSVTMRRMLELRQLAGGDGVRFQMFRFTPIPDSEMGRSVWKLKMRGNPGRVPASYRELLDFAVVDDPVEMFWLPERVERAVRRCYDFYAPLLFYHGALDAARARPVWRWLLRLFTRTAKWRVARGFYAFPVEKWLNDRFGVRLPLGADSGVDPEDDLLPAPPQMGQELSDLPPLEPAAGVAG